MRNRRGFESAVICIDCWNRDDEHLLFPASGISGETSFSKTPLASLSTPFASSPLKGEPTVWQNWKQKLHNKLNAVHSSGRIPVSDALLITDSRTCP